MKIVQNLTIGEEGEKYISLTAFLIKTKRNSRHNIVNSMGYQRVGLRMQIEGRRVYASTIRKGQSKLYNPKAASNGPTLNYLFISSSAIGNTESGNVYTYVRLTILWPEQ